MKNKQFIQIVIATITLVLLAFSAQGKEANQQEINLYSARKEALIKPLLDTFTHETGIKVNLVTGKAAALLQRLASEGRNSPADLLLIADAAYLQRAVQADLLMPMTMPELTTKVPAQYQDSKGRWIGLTVRARPIFYVKHKVNPSSLSTYEALAEPKWKSNICIRSSGNAYNQSMVASIIAAEGAQSTEQWARKLVANFARSPKGGDRDQLRAAAAGVCTIAIANTYYYGMMLADKDPVQRELANKMAIFWPNQDGRGTHVNVSGIGLVKSAKNKAAAEKLIKYLLSDYAQQWFMDHNFEFPVSPDIKPNKVLATWGTFKADPVPVWQLGELNSDAVRLMDRAGWK